MNQEGKASVRRAMFCVAVGVVNIRIQLGLGWRFGECTERDVLAKLPMACRGEMRFALRHGGASPLDVLRACRAGALGCSNEGRVERRFERLDMVFFWVFTLVWVSCLGWIFLSGLRANVQDFDRAATTLYLLPVLLSQVISIRAFLAPQRTAHKVMAALSKWPREI